VLSCQARGWIPHIVYLTDGYGVPTDDLRESADEYRRKRPEQSARYPLECLWLSWRHIGEVFGSSKNMVLQDLNELAKKYRFVFFSGFTPIAAGRIKGTWTFETDARRYSYWRSRIPHPIWRFTR